MKYLRKFDSVSDMETTIASLEIGILGMAYDGSTPVMRIKTGGTPVPPTPPVTKETPFYIEDVSGVENTVQITKSNSSAPTLTIQKSLDGVTWESMGSTSQTAITATVPANGKLYLRSITNYWGTMDSNNNVISITNDCNIGGNIMSLLYGSNFTGNENEFPPDSMFVFNGLFENNTNIINSSNLLLPAITMTWGCYINMFMGCTALTTAPALPATTLVNNCYNSMFKGCTSLTTAPAILPATTLANNCYNSMFMGCTALTTAPVLPAPKSAAECYASMFERCKALTTAPALPATTLANNCYNSMFMGCTALTTAPELPAPKLAQYCYNSMFNGCTNLNYIKCLATDISASGCTASWVTGVASTGTFVKNPNMSRWSTDANGIPEGWTVEDDAQV